MPFMKKHLLLFCSVFFILSCNEDSQTPHKVNMKNKLKTEIGVGHYRGEYKYNDLGYVEQITQYWSDNVTMTYKFTYEGDKIIRRVYDNDQGLLVQTDYFYIGNVIVEEKSKANDGTTSQVLYKYDEDENLIRSTTTVNDKLYEQLYFENEDGNIVKSRSILYNKDGSVYQDYTYKRGYDDKFHLTTMSYPENFRKINQEGKNNNLNPSGQGHITCTYNSENYPIKLDYGYQVDKYSYYE